MNRDEFIGKLQMVYVGEKNAFNELVGEYDRLNNIINELEKYIKDDFDIYCCNKKTQKTFKSVEIIIKAMILDKLKELKEDK